MHAITVVYVSVEQYTEELGMKKVGAGRVVMRQRGYQRKGGGE